MNHHVENSVHLDRDRHHSHPGGKMRNHTKSFGTANFLIPYLAMVCSSMSTNNIFTCVWSILLTNVHLRTFLTWTVPFLILTFKIPSLGLSSIHLTLGFSLPHHHLFLPPLTTSSSFTPTFSCCHSPGQMPLFFLSILLAFAASTFFMTSVPFATKFLNLCLRCLIFGSFTNSASRTTNSQDRPPCHWCLQNSVSACFSFPGSLFYLLMHWMFLFLILKLFLWLLL